jgi:hypothetical protein
MTVLSLSPNIDAVDDVSGRLAGANDLGDVWFGALARDEADG